VDRQNNFLSTSCTHIAAGFLSASATPYKARTQFKINFDLNLSPTNYELYAMNIIPLETSFKYESNQKVFSEHGQQ
jgi:hypothetical protein